MLSLRLSRCTRQSIVSAPRAARRNDQMSNSGCLRELHFLDLRFFSLSNALECPHLYLGWALGIGRFTVSYIITCFPVLSSSLVS